MQVIDDRRSEPRFHVDGRVDIAYAGQTCTAQVVDLSLNGALLALPADSNLVADARIALSLWIGATCHFNAEAHVAYLRGERAGIEFIGMSTEDFDTFSGLILLLARQRGTPQVESAERSA